MALVCQLRQYGTRGGVEWKELNELIGVIYSYINA